MIVESVGGDIDGQDTMYTRRDIILHLMSTACRKSLCNDRPRQEDFPATLADSGWTAPLT